MGSEATQSQEHKVFPASVREGLSAMFLSVRQLARIVNVPYATTWRAVRVLKLTPRREGGVVLLDYKQQLAVCEYLAAKRRPQ